MQLFWDHQKDEASKAYQNEALKIYQDEVVHLKVLNDNHNESDSVQTAIGVLGFNAQNYNEITTPYIDKSKFDGISKRDWKRAAQLINKELSNILSDRILPKH